MTTTSIIPGLDYNAESRILELLKSDGWQYDETKKVFVPVTVQEPTGIIKNDDKRIAFGWANVIKDVDGNVIVDRQGDYIDDDWELEKAAYDFNLYSRDGGNMHIRKGVADLIESVVFTPEKTAAMGIPNGVLPTGWWLGFHVNDDATWDGVMKQDFTGFSVHGNGLRKEQVLDGVPHVIPD